MLTVTDETGTTTRTYDELGRVLTKHVPNIGTITFTYDITDGMYPGCSSIRSRDPKGNITQKVYDQAGRLKEVMVGNDRTTYTYYDNGNRERIIYSNGSIEEYTYYANNQVKTLMNKKSDGSVMDSYTYTYDKAGNQLTKQEIINGINKGTTTYTYDVLNRLSTVVETNARNTTYTYDLAGNRQTETVVMTDTATKITYTTVNSYVYDSTNRLTSISSKVNNVLATVTDYTYDNNGNQLTKIVSTYANGTVTSKVTALTNTYDVHNQLIRANTDDGTVVNSIYNAEGYRVGKKVNGIWTYYLYEADKVVLEVNDDGTQKAWNVYGTNLLMREVGSESYYYFYNGHADVTALVAKDGTVAATYYYDAFGNILEKTGDVDNSIQYAGYQYDEETGLYYLNARMYDPVTARFMQEDTYAGDPNDPLSLNLYAYCAYNPIRYTDPTGHSWIEDQVFKFIKKSKAGKWVTKKAKDIYNYVDDKAPIVTGIYDAISNEVEGTLQMIKMLNDPTSILKKNVYRAVTDPKGLQEDAIRTYNTAKYVIDNPKEIADNIGKDIGSYFDTNLIHGNAHTRAEMVTHVVVFIASLFVGSGEAKAAKTAQQLAKEATGTIDELARVGAKTAQEIAEDYTDNAVNELSKVADDIVEDVSKIEGGGGVKIDSYKNMVKDPTVTGQAHHLSQDAAFRDIIPKPEGLSIEFKGNAFTEVGSQHYNAHNSLEGFWNNYRKGGDLYGEIPTVGEYNRALYNSLENAGISKMDSAYSVLEAFKQQRGFGVSNTDLVSRIPGRINQIQ